MNDFFIDSTLIANKLGIDKVIHNVKFILLKTILKFIIYLFFSNHMKNISNKYPLLYRNNKQLLLQLPKKEIN